MSAAAPADAARTPWAPDPAAEPQVQASEDPRRAALALHALARQDRRWVLDRLAPAQRRLVSGLLGELQALRIPADATLLKALHAPAATPASRRGAEAHATPEVLGEWLAREQPFVVAACLLDLSRDQQDRVLARLAPSQAEAARALMAGPLEQAHALRQAVRAALRARQAQAGTAPGQQTQGWRARLRTLWSRA